MFLVSWRSLGTARTEMTGMAGVSSFRRASQITPVCVSHLAPADETEMIKHRITKHFHQTWIRERLHREERKEAVSVYLPCKVRTHMRPLWLVD